MPATLSPQATHTSARRTGASMQDAPETRTHDPAKRAQAMLDGFDRVLRHAAAWDRDAEDLLDEVSCAIVRIQALLRMLGGLRDLTPSRSITADQLDLWLARCRRVADGLREEECRVMLSPEYRDDLAPDADLSSRIVETYELSEEGE